MSRNPTGLVVMLSLDSGPSTYAEVSKEGNHICIGFTGVWGAGNGYGMESPKGRTVQNGRRSGLISIRIESCLTAVASVGCSAIIPLHTYSRAGRKL